MQCVPLFVSNANLPTAPTMKPKHHRKETTQAPPKTTRHAGDTGQPRIRASCSSQCLTRAEDLTDLDRELAPKEPKLQNMGLVPGLELGFSKRFRSGDRAAAAIGWDVAVRLANGFSSLV